MLFGYGALPAALRYGNHCRRDFEYLPHFFVHAAPLAISFFSVYLPGILIMIKGQKSMATAISTAGRGRPFFVPLLN